MASYCEPRLSLAPGSIEDSIRVLVVEDDADSAELVRLNLTGFGESNFIVERCQNLVDAMARLRQPGIDVVLLDLGLPELSGFKSHRAIDYAAGREVPVVIYTADETAASRKLTLGAGAASYLIKDHCSPARLKEALRQAVLHVRTGRAMVD